MAKKKNKKKVSKSIAVKDQQLGKKKETAREKMIGQSIGYRYDVNLLPDYSKITPFLKNCIIMFFFYFFLFFHYFFYCVCFHF